LKEIQRWLEASTDCVTVYFSVWDLIDYSAEEFCEKLSMEIIDAYSPKLGLKIGLAKILKLPVITRVWKASTLQCIQQRVPGHQYHFEDENKAFPNRYQYTCAQARS